MWGQPGHLICVTTFPAGHGAAECPGAAERLTSGDMRPGTEDRSLGVGILTLSPDMPRDNQPHKCAAHAGVIVCLYADLAECL